jgi:hypothetical protein
MSLLNVRRERRQEGFGGPRGGPRLWKLLAALIFVIILYWYLGRVA